MILEKFQGIHTIFGFLREKERDELKGKVGSRMNFLPFPIRLTTYFRCYVKDGDENINGFLS